MKRGRTMTAALAVLCLFAGLLMLDPGQASAAGLTLSAALPALSDHGSLGLLGALAALGGTITLADLKQKRAALLDEMDTITKADLTDETRARFDAADTELRTLDADITRVSRLEEAQRQRAEQQAPKTETRSTVHAGVAEARDLGWEFGAFVRSYAHSQLLFRSGQANVQPSVLATGFYGEQHPVTQELTRAQVASENSTGGFLITPTLAGEFLRLFGPKTIVRKRARVVPGNASYLKGKGGASVAYVGENEQGPTTGVSFGMIDMTEKDISAILPISQKLLRNANTISIESYCRDELARAAAEFEDRMYFYGQGVGKQVKGYAFAIPAAMKFSAGAGATPDHAAVRALLRKILKAMANANVPIDGSAAWYMNPAIKMYLEDLFVGDVKAFPTLEGSNPTLMGYPVATTTQITGPAGTGGDIFFGVHSFAMVGDSVAMRLSTSDQASFVDTATGKQVNMWAQGLMAIKLDMSHDFALQYPEAFGMLTEVKWGQ